MSTQGNGGNPPSGNIDQTIIIPTPGVARKPTGQAPAPVDTPLTKEVIALRRGLNPLVNSASTLLTLVTTLRTTAHHANVPELHKSLTDELKRFESDAKLAGAEQETVIAARYLLCTVIDEIVLNTPWGSASGWSQHSLLSLFHLETFGGEKCFVILQRLLETPAKHLHILELYYLCLSLGFEGKYRLSTHGHVELERIRNNLFDTIVRHRPEADSDLSPHWQGSVKRQTSMMHYIPLWVFASLVLAVMLVVYGGFRLWLQSTTTPMADQIIEQLNTDASATNTSALHNKNNDQRTIV